MRYTPEQKAASHGAMLKAAGEVFRAEGFAGVGVDGLAAAAGMTSGAFYKHFRSKAEAFREVVRVGLERVLRRVRHAQAAHPEAVDEAWIDEFITIYFDPAHLASAPQGCLLPSLSAEVARSDPATREVYQAGLIEAATAMAERAPLAGRPDAYERAVAILALVAGGASMSRACPDEREAARVAEAARKAASQIAHGDLALARPRGPWRWRPAA